MHHWQDWVLAGCVLAFNIALVPSVLNSQKPKLLTSALTALFLIPEVIVFLSLSLWYSFIMALINALLWTTLALQRFMQMRSSGVK